MKGTYTRLSVRHRQVTTARSVKRNVYFQDHSFLSFHAQSSMTSATSST